MTRQTVARVFFLIEQKVVHVTLCISLQLLFSNAMMSSTSCEDKISCSTKSIVFILLWLLS